TPTGASPTCHYTGMELSDWDGYGHLRTAQSNGRRTGFVNGAPTELSEQRTVTTGYNPRANAQGLTSLGAMLFPPGSNWVLNTYDAVIVTDATGTAKQQYCYNTTTGFLGAHRTLAGTTPQSSDLLAVFTRDESTGNLQSEQYYGGDGGDASADPDVCVA